MPESSLSFHFATARTQMSFRVADGGQLLLCYYGARLECPEDAFLAPAAEGPFYPTELDSRAAWGNMSGEYALDIVQPDGMRSAQLLYTGHEWEKRDGVQRLVFTLKDPVYPVEIRLRLTAHEDSDVFEQEVSIVNMGKAPVFLHRAASGCLRMRGSSYRAVTFRGAWAGESLLREEEIACGNTLCVASETGTRAAQEGTPGFLLSLDGAASEESGRVVLGALAWPGNYELSFKHAPDGSLFARAGLTTPVPFLLGAGKALSLPRLLLSYSNRGKGRASRNFHRWARAYGIRDGSVCRPTVLNSWEGAYFSFDEELLHRMMADAADLGIETFVLDDGWFANKYPRDNDGAGLGDWETNRAKLPHGLQGLAEKARSLGLRFGLWVEPEMVNPCSELFARHSEWVLQLPNRKLKEERHQLVLDLTNPEVRRFILQTMDRLLTGHPGISYIKWDCNRKISDAGSTFLSPREQGNLAVAYAHGYEEIVGTLSKLHPGVTFQACASGGGRADYGTMRHHHEFWVSDNTDPVERLGMQWSLGHFFPAMAMGAHVTASPNHQTGRATPLKFRFDTAMSARLGFELQPGQLTDEERAFVREGLAVYQRLRPIVQLGDLYRLKSPFDGGPSCSLLYRLQDGGKERIVLFAWQWGRLYTDRTERILLHGVDPAKRYSVEEQNLDDAGVLSPFHRKTISGVFLKDACFPLKWNKPVQSAVWLLTET